MAPINTLPSEILSHIFSILFSEQIRAIEETRYTRTAMFPVYPDILSHVCSLWRQVAIGTCTLWSYVNLSPHQTIDKGLLSRAKICAIRSGQSPLQIHILDLGPRFPGQHGDEANLFQFLASNAARTSSLELATDCQWTKFHRSILHSYFVNGVPGVLTRLILANPSACDYPPYGFIEAAANPRHAKSVLLDISEQRLDDLLFPVGILQLDNIFPYWTSKAYHGLVELRLRSRGRNAPSITESQLIGILASSPRLRIFYFSVGITKVSPKNASIVPVYLNELEELGLGFMPFRRLGTVLRLFAPGLNLPRASLSVDTEPITPAFDADTKSFFARSNVSKLYVYGVNTLLWIPEIYRLAPRLQTLVLREFYPRHYCAPESIPNLRDARALYPFDELYLLHPTVQLNQLQWMLKRYPTRRLTLWNVCVVHNGKYVRKFPDLGEILAQDCPVVSVLDDQDPNPIVDWE